MRWSTRAPLALSALAVGFRLGVGPLTIDDAYITFRYARNIAEGLGFVYNAGEHVLGTTTPLYAALMAALYALGASDLPRTALAVNALADGVTTYLLYRLAQRLSLGRWSLLVAALFAINPMSVAFAASGMETSAFVLWIAAACFAAAEGRLRVAAAVATLATLTRPEGLILVGLVIAQATLVRRDRLATLVIPGAIALPWLAFAVLYFGSPIPQTMVAKAGGNPAWRFDSLTLLLSQPVLPGQSVLIYSSTDPPLLPARILLAAITLLLAVLLRRQVAALVGWARVHPSALVSLAFAPSLVAAYGFAALRGNWLFLWYLAPLAPFYTLALVGLARSFCRDRGRIGPAVAATLMLIWTLAGLSLGRQADLPFFAPLHVNLLRERAFLAAAADLNPQLTPDTLVAPPEIGAFGYASRARILDVCALVSPEALGVDPSRLIRERQPRFIVGLDLFVANALQSDVLATDYRLRQSYPARTWGGTAVLVYERVAR